MINVISEYFGIFIFGFVFLVGSLVVLPETTGMPGVSPSEIVGLLLAFIVIAGGFSWYYFASATPPRRRQEPRRQENGS